MKFLLHCLLFCTPVVVISLPVYLIYKAIQDKKQLENPEHWEPESPYEVAPPPERNQHYGVDL